MEKKSEATFLRFSDSRGKLNLHDVNYIYSNCSSGQFKLHQKLKLTSPGNAKSEDNKTTITSKKEKANKQTNKKFK